MTGKEKYESIPIPGNLKQTVENAIAYGLMTSKHTYRFTGNLWKRRIAVTAACLVLFVCLLNCNPSLVLAVEEIPVLGQVFQVFVFREIHQQEEFQYIDAVIPEIQYDSDSQMENRVNLEIRSLIYEELQRSEKRAEEYYQAFTQTGGNPEDFHPISVTIDYEVKSVTEKMASFVISKCETLASAYNIQYFYNIDLETGDYITLQDWLGPEYRQIASQSIQKQIEGWPKEKQEMVFPETDIENLITENRNFYIDTKGRAVVVFDKYEIAAGAAGILEFPIEAENVETGE